MKILKSFSPYAFLSVCTSLFVGGCNDNILGKRMKVEGESTSVESNSNPGLSEEPFSTENSSTPSNSSQVYHELLPSSLSFAEEILCTYFGNHKTALECHVCTRKAHLVSWRITNGPSQYQCCDHCFWGKQKEVTLGGGAHMVGEGAISSPGDSFSIAAPSDRMIHSLFQNAADILLILSSYKEIHIHDLLPPFVFSLAYATFTHAKYSMDEDLIKKSLAIFITFIKDRFEFFGKVYGISKNPKAIEHWPYKVAKESADYFVLDPDFSNEKAKIAFIQKIEAEVKEKEFAIEQKAEREKRESSRVCLSELHEGDKLTGYGEKFLAEFESYCSEVCTKIGTMDRTALVAPKAQALLSALCMLPKEEIKIETGEDLLNVGIRPLIEHALSPDRFRIFLLIASYTEVLYGIYKTAGNTHECDFSVEDKNKIWLLTTLMCYTVDSQWHDAVRQYGNDPKFSTSLIGEQNVYHLVLLEEIKFLTNCALNPKATEDLLQLSIEDMEPRLKFLAETFINASRLGMNELANCNSHIKI